MSGYSPLVVNSWTLEGGVTGFAQDGVYYYLLDTLDLNPFADHTVYLAFYEGSSIPSRDQFTMGEDGSIAFREDVTGAHALFTLPLTRAWPTRRPPRTLLRAPDLIPCSVLPRNRP